MQDQWQLLYEGVQHNFVILEQDWPSVNIFCEWKAERGRGGKEAQTKQ